MCRLPLPRGLASLELSGLLPGGAPITAAVLGTEVQPAVVVVVTDVPGLSLEDALAAASAVLEPRLHPRTERPAAHPVGRSVSARLPRFGLRLQTSSHVAVDPARPLGGETHPLRVERHASRLENAIPASSLPCGMSKM